MGFSIASDQTTCLTYVSGVVSERTTIRMSEGTTSR